MGQFYSNQHTDTAVDAAARRERNARIVDMLASHSPLEVAEIVGVSASTVSQVARKAGLPPRWGNGKKNGKRKPAEPEIVIPPVVAEIISNHKTRPKPNPVESRLPVVRAAGFAGYPAVYVWCWSCGFRTWQAPGAPLTCPKCARTLQIVYTPRMGE
jgi:hypothetical protein